MIKQIETLLKHVVQDVETRWSLTQGLFERLMHSMEAIKLHERLNDITLLLSSVEWCTRGLLLTVLDPLIYV